MASPPVPITKNLMTMYKELKEHKERKQIVFFEGRRLSSVSSATSPGVELPGIPRGEERKPEAENGGRSHLCKGTWVEKTLCILQA